MYSTSQEVAEIFPHRWVLEVGDRIPCVPFLTMWSKSSPTHAPDRHGQSPNTLGLFSLLTPRSISAYFHSKLVHLITLFLDASLPTTPPPPPTAFISVPFMAHCYQWNNLWNFFSYNFAWHTFLSSYKAIYSIHG